MTSRTGPGDLGYYEPLYRCVVCGQPVVSVASCVRYEGRYTHRMTFQDRVSIKYRHEMVQDHYPVVELNLDEDTGYFLKDGE